MPRSREITGNLMMPGFTAPKLLWVARHEPDLFDRVRRVLLPKDWLRWRLTGAFATDMSDASGTLWLDVGRREWNDELLAACGLSSLHMPELHEGPESRVRCCRKWRTMGLAGSAGRGRRQRQRGRRPRCRRGAPRRCMLSLGTSGVVFVATGAFVANTQQAVHSFCHALPRAWHLMSVMLSAASCLDFTASCWASAMSPRCWLRPKQRGLHEGTPLFLPYLNGERTPHNNPHAKAVFFGLDANSARADLVNATLEGVCHGMGQGIAALQAVQPQLDRVSLIGGGSRSAYWAQMLADATGLRVVRHADSEVGPSLGAARLAWLAQHPHEALASFRRRRWPTRSSHGPRRAC